MSSLLVIMFCIYIGFEVGGDCANDVFGRG